jgi:hypothetical protein
MLKNFAIQDLTENSSKTDIKGGDLEENNRYNPPKLVPHFEEQSHHPKTLIPTVAYNSNSESLPQISCKVCFKSLDDILIKFFLKDSLDNQLDLLLSLNPPRQVLQSLNNIAQLFEIHDVNLVENKVISNILQVQKNDISELTIEKFLDQFAILQKYFYSPEFIQKCQQ